MSGLRSQAVIALVTALSAGVVVAAAFPAPSVASELIAVNASGVQLQVDSQGHALVTYSSEGRRQSVLASGAINARPPTPGGSQVSFQLVRGGSLSGRNVCRSYRGEPLRWLIAACTAPDGSNWAVQAWQRMLPNYGLAPTPVQAAWELRLSHWSGPVAKLEIKTDWAYRRFDHLYGRLTYRGRPVHGFHSTSRGEPLDAFGRNIYVDTLNSAYGRGWKRENSFLAQGPYGGFCYGFYPHGGRPPGQGARYRATVIGPGVTPDVFWEGVAPGRYDRARDVAANAEQRPMFGSRSHCKIS
jgi:hypothetical protein